MSRSRLSLIDLPLSMLSITEISLLIQGQGEGGKEGRREGRRDGGKEGGREGRKERDRGGGNNKR